MGCRLSPPNGFSLGCGQAAAVASVVSLPTAGAVTADPVLIVAIAGRAGRPPAPTGHADRLSSHTSNNRWLRGAIRRVRLVRDRANDVRSVGMLRRARGSTSLSCALGSGDSGSFFLVCTAVGVDH